MVKLTHKYSIFDYSANQNSQLCQVFQVIILHEYCILLATFFCFQHYSYMFATFCTQILLLQICVFNELVVQMPF